MVDNPTPAVEVAQSPVRIALEYVSPTIAAAFEDNLCLIWSGEWQAYWREGGHGYTKLADQAGVFTILAAYARTQHCDPTKQIAFERVPTPSPGGEVEKLRGAGRQAARDIRAAMHRSLNSGHKQAHMNYGPLTVCLDHIETALASPPPVEGQPYSAEDEALYTRWIAGDETLDLSPEQYRKFQQQSDREIKERAR